MIDLPPQGWLIVDKMTKLVQHFSQLGPNRPDHLSGCQEAQSQGPCPQTSLPHRKLLSTASTQPRPHRGQEYQDRASLLPREVAQFKGWRNPPGPETEAELHYPEFLELAKKEMSFMQGEAQLPTSCRGRERGEPGRGLAGGGRAVCGERGWRAGRAARRRRRPPARRRRCRLRTCIPVGPASGRRSLRALRSGRRLRADAGPGRRRG